MIVNCRCNVRREIDTAKVGPWRLRCKQCGDVLYDPSASDAAPLPGSRDDLEAKAANVLSRLTPAPRADSEIGTVPQATGQESTFQQWLEGSAELQVMHSSDGANVPRCQTHPDRRIVAACTRCAQLLCKNCLDRIDDEFACASCVTKVAAHLGESGENTGLMGWFKRVFKG
jgi:hypothetical protein